METLTIEGKKFVKASKAAKDHGYTADYIGQLCRAGKVEAKLVGRSWYVALDSLNDHKATRYQKISPKLISVTEPKEGYAVSVHHPRESMEENTSSGSPRKLEPGHEREPDKTFYRRVRKPLTVPNYSADDSALLPPFTSPKTDTHKHQGSETGISKIVPVALADANFVSVHNPDHEYAFTAPQRPKIAFHGSLDVTEVPQEHPVILPSEKVTQQPSVTLETESSVAITAVSQKSAQSGRKVTVNSSQPKLSQRHKAHPSARTHIGSLKVTRIPSSDSPAEIQAGSRVRVVVAAAILLALAGTVALLGFQSEVVADKSLTQNKISFTIEHLFASVYGTK